MDLAVRTETVGGVPVLEVSGELDLATVPRLRGELVRLVGDHAGRIVTVDLDGVTGLDDTGIGIILGAAGHARDASGDLVVVCSDERLLSRFASTGFERAVRIIPAVHDL